MIIKDIVSVIGLIGIGGLLKSAFDFFIGNQNRKSQSKHEFKQLRYKTIILLCFTFLYYDREKPTLLIHRPDLKSKDDLHNEIFAEWNNMMLYASDKVISALREYLKNSNQEYYNRLIISMRKDLYGIRTKVKSEDLIIPDTIIK